MVVSFSGFMENSVKLMMRFVALSTLVLGLVGVWWFASVRHRHRTDSMTESVFIPPEGEMPGHPTPSAETFVRHPDIVLTESQRRELEYLFREINEAYTNCQVEALRTCFARVPECFYRVSTSVYLEYNHFLYSETCTTGAGCLDKDRFPLAHLLQTDDVERFENYVHVCFEAARFSAGYFIRRGVYGECVGHVEPRMLNRLQVLKRHFQETGRSEFAAKTDALIAEWCEQIESPTGLTRLYALHLVDLYLFARRQNPRDCWSSNEWILNLGRAQADPFVRIGYTPQWRDAEFPPSKDVRQGTSQNQGAWGQSL